MSSEAPPLDVALVGAGLGGATFHAPFIDTTPGLRLATIVTTSDSRRADAAVRYPGVHFASSVEEMLAMRPALVAISTPNATHFPIAKAALEAGAHVVVDKPFAATAGEARQLGIIAREVGRLAIPFQNRRWDGDYLTLRSLIADGTLGDVIRMESRFDRWRPEPKPGWCRPDAKEHAENVVHDLGTHLIDQALQLFGPVSWVHAEVRRVHPAVTSWDDMFVSLTHANGVQSHLSSTMRAGIPGPRYHVFGTESAYLKHGVDPQEAALRMGGRPHDRTFGEEPIEQWGKVGDGLSELSVQTLRGNYGTFYAAVAAAIIDGAPPPVTVDEAVATLEVVDTVLEGAR